MSPAAEGGPLQDSTFSRQSSPEELVLPPTVVELVDEFAGRRSYFISDASELLAALTSGIPRPPGPEPRYADPDVSIYDHDPAASSSSSTHQYLHEQSEPAGLSQVQENAPPRPNGPLHNLFRADPRTLGKFVLASVFGELQGRNWRLPADPDESETTPGDHEHSGTPRRQCQWKNGTEWLREHVNPLSMAWVRSRARQNEEAQRVREFVVEKSGAQLTYAWLMREEVREVKSYLAYLRKKLEELTARLWEPLRCRFWPQREQSSEMEAETRQKKKLRKHQHLHNTFSHSYRYNSFNSGCISCYISCFPP
eukprot:g5260.t1